MKTYRPIFVLTLALTIAHSILAQAQVAVAESPSATRGTRPQVLPPAGCWYSFTSGSSLSYCVSVNAGCPAFRVEVLHLRANVQFDCIDQRHEPRKQCLMRRMLHISIE